MTNFCFFCSVLVQGAVVGGRGREAAAGVSGVGAQEERCQSGM